MLSRPVLAMKSLFLGIHWVCWRLSMQWKPDWRTGAYDVNRKFPGCIATLLILPMSTSTGLLAVVYMPLHPTSRSQNHRLLARALSLGATTLIRASNLLHIDKINLTFTLVTFSYTTAFWTWDDWGFNSTGWLCVVWTYYWHGLKQRRFL